MPKVTIDGIEYVPKCEIPELTDERLSEVLKGLTSMLYFREEHKSMTHAWEVLNNLSPDLAKIAADNPMAAYKMVHPENSEFLDRTIYELERTVIETKKTKCGKYDYDNYFFELTTRSINVLKAAHPTRWITLSELLEHRVSDLFDLPNLGKKSVNEIIKSLERVNLITGNNFSLRDATLPRSSVVDELVRLRAK